MTQRQITDIKHDECAEEFKGWLKKLDEVAKSYGHTTSYTEDTGADCWRGYFDDGLSPEDAYQEDCSHG